MDLACVVMIVVDGLRADALGSYGNAQAETPFLDRLAAESVVYDLAFSLDPAVDSFYESILLRAHPAYRHLGSAPVPHRDDLSSLADAGSHYLVTDEPAVCEGFPARRVWTDALTIPTAETRPGEEPGGLFAAAAQWLGDRFHACRGGFCVGWIHVSLARLGKTIASRLDYDALVTRLDEGVCRLFAELSFPDSRRLLCIVTSARGYALGEHGQFGTGCAALHEELVHVPLIVHAFEEGIEPLRINRLTSPIDLGGYVLDWLVQSSREEPRVDSSPCGREWLANPAGLGSPNYLFFANAPGDLAISTPGWYLIRRPASEEESLLGGTDSAPLQLFLKPDDRWEFNEVSSLRPEIAEMLAANLDELERQARSGEPLCLPLVPDELLKGS